MSKIRLRSFFEGNASVPPGHVVLVTYPGIGSRLALTATYSWDSSQVSVYFEAVDASGRPAYDEWLQTFLEPVDLGSIEAFQSRPSIRAHLPFCALACDALGPQASNALILVKALRILDNSDAVPGPESSDFAVRAALAENEALLRERKECAAGILSAYLAA